MKLVEPSRKGPVSFEEAVSIRRTVRSFDPRPLTARLVSQLLWAGLGVTDPAGRRRAAPSAGALYPVDLMAVVGHDAVEGMKAGLYRYEPPEHSVTMLLEGDHRDEIARASLSQFWMAKAPVNILITAELSRITGKYGSRGERYALLEAGHVAQNVMLQACSLGLASGIVGAFADAEIIRVLALDPRTLPLLILPVGYARK